MAGYTRAEAVTVARNFTGGMDVEQGMRQKSLSRLIWGIGIAFGLLAIGAVSVAGYIAKTQGLSSFWNRKRAVIERVRPESAPLLDRAERAARQAVGR
jgi:hypothetical protein